MHTVIAAEALFFVLAFAKGAGIMLGYDILRAFRRGFPHGDRLVAASKAPKFKAGKALKDMINN